MLRFGTNVITGKKLTFPFVMVENVYIFPGSPTFFETSFQTLCKVLICNNRLDSSLITVNREKQRAEIVLFL